MLKRNYKNENETAQWFAICWGGRERKTPSLGGPLEATTTSLDPTLETSAPTYYWCRQGLFFGIFDVLGWGYYIIFLFCLEDVPFPHYLRGFRHFYDYFHVRGSWAPPIYRRDPPSSFILHVLDEGKPPWHWVSDPLVPFGFFTRFSWGFGASSLCDHLVYVKMQGFGVMIQVSTHCIVFMKGWSTNWFVWGISF